MSVLASWLSSHSRCHCNHPLPSPHSPWPADGGTVPRSSHWSNTLRHMIKKHISKTYRNIYMYNSTSPFHYNQLLANMITSICSFLLISKRINTSFLTWHVQFTQSDVSQQHFLLYASLIFISCLVFSSPVISCVFLLPAPAACLCATGLSSVPLAPSAVVGV